MAEAGAAGRARPLSFRRGEVLRCQRSHDQRYDWCRLYQLVWRSAKLFSYDASNFEDVKQLATPLQVRG